MFLLLFKLFTRNLCVIFNPKTFKNSRGHLREHPVTRRSARFFFVFFFYLLPVNEEDERVGPGPGAGLWIVGRHAAVRCGAVRCVLRALSCENVRVAQRTGPRLHAGACPAAGSVPYRASIGPFPPASREKQEWFLPALLRTRPGWQ